MSKEFFLVDPRSSEIRRQSDVLELDIVLRSRYRRANPTPPEGAGPDPDKSYAVRSIEAVKSASPGVCQLTDVTSVCYRDPPKEERPRGKSLRNPKGVAKGAPCFHDDPGIIGPRGS